MIYTVSLGFTRGYEHQPALPPPACPSFSSTAVFLLLHKAVAPSHKKCNEQSGWGPGTEPGLGHASLGPLRTHAVAERPEHRPMQLLCREGLGGLRPEIRGILYPVPGTWGEESRISTLDQKNIQ